MEGSRLGGMDCPISGMLYLPMKFAKSFAG